MNEAPVADVDAIVPKVVEENNVPRLKVFAPVYALLPWPVRHEVMKAMPGSHRKRWAPPPPLRGPAV